MTKIRMTWSLVSINHDQIDRDVYEKEDTEDERVEEEEKDRSITTCREWTRRWYIIFTKEYKKILAKH